MNKSQQQRNNVKQRKAKARAKAEKEFGSWQKKRVARMRAISRPMVSPFAGMGLASAAAQMIIDPIPSKEEMRSREQLLCRLFGEPYRP